MLAILCYATAILSVSAAPPEASPNSPVALPDSNTSKRMVCPQLKRLEVLPGRGWDNLRNKDMGAVIAFTYEKCKTTDDGEYLIPDNFYVIPVKQSDLELSSEMFEHWMNYSSLTSYSFRINAGGNLFGKWSVEGSFSSDFENAKRRQIEEKSITTRVTVRNTVYSVGIEPNAALDPGLRALLESALTELQNNNTNKVDVIMEFIVRDYGTHYSTHMDAGAILSKEDFISTKFLEDNWASKSSINAAAGVSFKYIFNFGIGTQNTVSDSFLQGYRTNITSSSVKALGGGMLKSNMSVNEWVDAIPNNLVAVDRSGEPLHFIITPTNFPGVPLKLLLRLRNELEQSIKQYYSYNTHKGCLNRNSPNFDIMANADDGSCRPPLNNYTFGGVYQICQSLSTSAGDLCSIINQKNPLTGSSSCPKNFIPVLLNTGVKTNYYSDTKYGQQCSGWWIFKRCKPVSWKEEHYSESHYQTYWCVASVFPVAPKTGYMFGGLFTSVLNNPLTQSKSCPSFFIPLRMGSDLQVCVSDDYQLGVRNSAQFGGFFSCSQGNPLLLNNTVKSPPGGFPSGCPDGHTQHMAAIDNDCEIHYCVTPDTFLSNGQIPIVLPPFRDTSSLFQNVTLALTMTAADEISEPSVSSGGIAGIVIACVASVIILAGVVIWRKRKWDAVNRSSTYGPIGEDSPLINDRTQSSSQGETVGPV